MRARKTRGWAAALTLAVAGCADPSPTGTRAGEAEIADGPFCTIPQERLTFVLNKDGVRALSNPTFVQPGHPGAAYLRASDRVIGLEVVGRALAVPLNILWYHEVVNLDRDGVHVAVTHCPLTGSSLAFDRAAHGDAELGVSGLLLDNNLVLYDRSAEESLWPQMMRGPVCGPAAVARADMTMYPSLELRWDAWVALHPETEVVSSETGFGRPYGVYPLGDYDDPDNPTTLFPIPVVDTSRPPKELVFGIPMSLDGGTAFPFGELGPGRRAVATRVTEGPLVVLWDGAAEGAAAFFTRVADVELDFVVADGRFEDVQTRSRWTLDGRAVSGPLAGARLLPLAESYTAFWFAWARFQPESFAWTPAAGG